MGQAVPLLVKVREGRALVNCQCLPVRGQPPAVGGNARDQSEDSRGWGPDTGSGPWDSTCEKTLELKISAYPSIGIDRLQCGLENIQDSPAFVFKKI